MTKTVGKTSKLSKNVGRLSISIVLFSVPQVATASHVRGAARVGRVVTPWANAAPLTTDATTGDRADIPRILHMAYVPLKPVDMPIMFEQNQEKWKSLHPAWKFIQWNETGHRTVLEKFYPWFIQTYDNLDEGIKKLDAMRYVYMHLYGGVYTDMDIDVSRPIDQFLNGRQIILYNRAGGIQNSFMASVPGHPFWLELLHSIESIHPLSYTHHEIYDDILCETGWPVLTSVWDHRFHGVDTGVGKLNDANYIVYSENEFESVLGLKHYFFALWFKSHHDNNCEKNRNGWKHAMKLE